MMQISHQMFPGKRKYVDLQIRG